MDSIAEDPFILRAGGVQIGRGVSRMTCDRKHLGMCRLDAVLQLHGEKQIRQLALPVGKPFVVAAFPLEIIEADAAQPMRAARDVHHPRAVGCTEHIEEQSGERELP